MEKATAFGKIRARLIAASYDLVMSRVEKKCLRRWRRELLISARGDLLEIGSGTGMNLPFYRDTLASIRLSEPDNSMRRKLTRKVHQDKLAPKIRMEEWTAESIGLPANSLDTVVSTLVLCSVCNLGDSLAEIRRVLRPGGRLIFLEHVISEQSSLRRWQQRLEPFWSCCAGNCHLTRDTAAAIRLAGFTIKHLTDEPMFPVPPFVRRTIRGVALKL